MFSIQRVLETVNEMKTSAMNTSIFSPIYAMDETSSSPAIPQLHHPLILDPKSSENDYDQRQILAETESSTGQDVIYRDEDEEEEDTHTSDLSQLSTQIELEIPHILDSGLSHPPLG